MAAHPTRQHAYGSSSRSASGSSGSSGGAKGAAPGPALVPLGHHAGKPTIPITRPVTVIGSRSTARINLISSTVSKAHALLVKSNGGLYVRDLASRSRVYVNDVQVREADLADGDEIKVGSFTFKYVAGPLRGRAARDIERSLPAAELDVTGGEFPIPIDQRVMLIGRRSSADIVLLEDSASTAHAVIFEMDGARYVRDLGSRTGTFVNGVSTHQHKLAPGDIIRIGETDIRYQTAAAAAHAPQALEKTGESATGYALEARDEIELPAPGDDEHETMGGLDLVGEIVKEEVDRYDQPKRKPTRAPAEQPPKAKTPPPPLPLELEEVVRAGGEPETPAGEALPLDELEELYEKAAPPPKRPAPSASTDIEDLSDELLADEPVAAESSSAPEAPAETIAPVADETAAAPGAEEAEINIRRGWRSALHEEGQAQAEEAREAQAEEPAPAAEQEQTSDVLRFPDQSLAVRDERDEAADTFGADVGADVGGSSADVAVLEPEPILPGRERDRERDTLSFPDSIDAQARDEDAEAIAAEALADTSAGDTGAAIDEPAGLNLEIPEPPAPEQATVDVSNFDLGVKDEPAPVGELDLGEVPAEEPVAAGADEPPAPAPALDFSVQESAADAGALPELEPIEEPPPPPLKLTEDAEALASATEALTKRSRRAARPPAAGKRKPPPSKRRRKGEPAFDAPPEPAAEAPVEPAEPVEPFAFEEPAIDIPPIEQIDAPVEPLPPVEAQAEVLEPTQPTPDSALHLDLDDISAADIALADDPNASADALTDSRFAKAVEELSGGGAVGEIVEPAPSPAPAEQRGTPPAEPPAPDPFKVGANQENFLGGVPLPKKPAKPAPLPEPTPALAQHDPVDDLIAEIDTAAAAAERARVEAPTDDEARDRLSADVAAAPFLPTPPAVPRMPQIGKGRPVAKRGVELGALPAHVDESIPPFKGGDATTGTVTTAFDGLAMPPVRQADVFSQMSPPAAAADPDIDPSDASGIMTPMDLTGIKREPPVPKRRPRPVPGAYKVPGDPFFGSGAGGGAEAPFVPPVPTPAPAPDKPQKRKADLAPENLLAELDEEPAASTTIDNDETVLDVGAPSGTELGFELDQHERPDAGSAGEMLSGTALTPSRRRVRPALPAEHGGSEHRRPPVMYAMDDVEVSAAATRRKYLKRVPVLLALGAVLIIGAVAAVYAMFPVKSVVEASVTYRNLAERTQRDRQEIQEDQLRRLRSDYLREAARRKVLQTPELSPGFLDDTIAYSRVTDRAGWRQSNNAWALHIAHEGTQRDADAARVKALAAALWEDNKTGLIRAANEARNQVRQLEETIASDTRRLDELKSQIASQRILYEKRPSPEQVKSLETELARLEDAWKKAVTAVKDAEAELARVKSGGATATRDAQLRDDELAKMQRELDGLNARAEQARNTSSEQARQAKQQLDGAMEAFGKEIASAGTLFPGNPEVTAYIDSAQRLLETTRGVIADMTRRQEKQFNDLMELKARLNEKMEARRDEQWQADKELQDLTERLAILTRQYNAAVGGGLKREAEEKKAEVELTQSMIKARQELIPADPGYADAIRQIEQFIDSTKKNIEEDRTRTDALLVQLQKSFTSGPQVANLPADQRELAKRLQDKLASINAARQQYNRSLDAGAARVSDETLAQQIAALQAGIEARKKLLAEQQGEAAAQAPEAIKQKQIELDNLKQNQKKAEDAYFAARQELDNTRRATADATATLEKLQKLEDQRKLLEQSLKTQNDTLVSKQRDLTTAVYPEQPGDNDVRIVEGTDRRLTYAAVAGGSIFLLFSALITLTLQRAARFGPAASVAPGDLRPIQHPHPQPSASNGNGATHDDDEDERPAVV